jgi:hypothetical protein
MRGHGAAKEIIGRLGQVTVRGSETGEGRWPQD